MSAVETDLTFPDYVSKQLKKFASKYRVFAFTGRPGCGKGNAIKTTFKAAVVFPLISQHIKADGTIGIKGAQQICKKLQPTLDGDPIWVIEQSDLFTEEAVKHIISSASTKVILVGNNKVNIDCECLLRMPKINENI